MGFYGEILVRSLDDIGFAYSFYLPCYLYLIFIISDVLQERIRKYHVELFIFEFAQI